MFFHTKPPYIPTNGERRIRVKFAWRPEAVQRGHAQQPAGIVWLGRYEIHEYFWEPAGGNPGWWVESGRHLYWPEVSFG